MKNLLIESKKIYSNKIINLLYIKIYKGFSSIYEEAKNVSQNENILQLFQKFIGKIPLWDEQILEREKLRIMGTNKDLITKILKAITKINLKILTNANDSLEINEKILNNFIHNIYKFTYVAIWDNPFLFYHDLEPEIIKKNQREVYEIIKESINRALDELIDLNNIVDNFLNEDLDKDENQMKYLIKKIEDIENKILLISSYPNQKGGNMNISEILNKNNIKISESNNESSNSLNNSLNINDKPLNGGDNKDMTITNNNDSREKTIDSKIDNIIEKDLKMTEEEMTEDDDGKKSYKPEESEQYQEVFSNSEVVKTSANSMNSLNSIQKGENLKRNKFFSNYLNF
jgi:hypothetical protein